MQRENRPVKLLQHEPVSASAERTAPPRVRGKFLYVGDEKLYVRGVTYGTFRPGADGEYDPSSVERDFALMAKHDVNAIRVYTVPPRWLLDAACRHGLHVMVGLPWEQHVAFLDDQKRVRSIEERVRAAARACAGHPAILCYAIGNEIPASIVRWHGARRVERFLERLYRAVKAEDPGALVTYVNYPSTEYLQLDFVDLVCFNVYLESEERLAPYLARLQNLAGDRPLLLAEVGLDSRRHGEAAQASTLSWQVRTTFASGCAGVFVFAWTDEWHRGGFDIDDWDFGLTARDRQPKPALAAVRGAFAEVPFGRDLPWPRVSVVVCSHNGARTIRDTLEGLRCLDYPNFEVIVVDDGSSDRTASVVAAFAARTGAGERVRVVSHEENRGYGEALRSGLNAARGDSIFFTDADRQFHLDDIERLLEHYGTSPIVVGYRLKRNDPRHRLFVARVYHATLKAVFGLRVRDVDCAFKLFDRAALDGIRPELVSRSAFISPELLIRARLAGVSIQEVGIPHYPRAAGRPKGATPKVIARTIKEIFVMRRRLGSMKHPAAGAGARDRRTP